MNNPAESDAAALGSSEELDEDELGLDPLEKGGEPPEHWSAADHYGMAASEQYAGESLEQRVREEQADADPTNTARAVPPAERPLAELDDSVDDPADDVAQHDAEKLVADEPEQLAESPMEGQWQNADRAGGSTADEIREPPEVE